MTVIVFCVFSVSASVFADSKTYVFRKRAEWVKLVKLSNKQMGGQVLLHPHTAVSVKTMTDILSGLKMNKAQGLKKGFKTNEVFSSEEAQKYAPFIVQALGQAGPNQVVNVSVVHKRPYFMVRHDYLSLINVYVKDDGIHFYFSKLFARLDGDYEQASRIYESIRKAKSLRVSLAPQSGQIISSDGNELVVRP